MSTWKRPLELARQASINCAQLPMAVRLGCAELEGLLKGFFGLLPGSLRFQGASQLEQDIRLARLHAGGFAEMAKGLHGLVLAS